VQSSRTGHFQVWVVHAFSQFYRSTVHWARMNLKKYDWLRNMIGVLQFSMPNDDDGQARAGEWCKFLRVKVRVRVRVRFRVRVRVRVRDRVRVRVWVIE
jgi:hypothetical protein